MVKKELHEEEEKSKEPKLMEFTRQDYEFLCDNCMFSDLQEKILKDRIKDKSIIEISLNRNISESTVKREIRKIKKKIKRVL